MNAPHSERVRILAEEILSMEDSSPLLPNLRSTDNQEAIGIYELALGLARRLRNVPAAHLAGGPSDVAVRMAQKLDQVASTQKTLIQANESGEISSGVIAYSAALSNLRNKLWQYNPETFYQFGAIEAGDASDRSNSAIAADLASEAKVVLEEAKAALEAAKLAAASDVARSSSARFQKQAALHSTSKKLSLFLVVALTSLTLYLVIATSGLTKNTGAWFVSVVNLKGALLYNALASKFLIVGLLTYLTVTFARNYRAHQNLEVLNTHRSNSLESFETFMTASEEPETRKAILREVSCAIFSMPPSGFLGKESDGTTHPVLEIVNSLGTSVAKSTK